MTSLSSRPLSGFRILVVEDDADLLKIMGSVLQNKGAAVTKAINGQDGLDAVHSQCFDLVISDVQMPVMTGVELLQRIRDKDPHLPVVLLVTGHAQISEQDALASGAAGLIKKPFKIGTLMQKLEELALIAEGQVPKAG